MTIGELSSVSGIPASTIRYWEKIGVLPEAVRSSGQRRYFQDSLDRLSVLQLAQECGFRLDEMRYLFHGFSPGIPASPLGLSGPFRPSFLRSSQNILSSPSTPSLLLPHGSS